MTHILIVDDKEENVYYLQALLTGNGWIVDAARHGAEALIKARQAPPDLIISDLLMPVMDGYTLLSHWKADPRLRRIPFIVYTATYTDPDDELLAMRLGADAFILKPCEPEDFLTRIREIEARGGSAAPIPARAPIRDEKDLLKLYSETLIRKLEEKSLQLEETNRALGQDIAQRKQAEAALRKSEAEFRLLAESMPQIVWITRPDGKNIYFNQHWMDYTGLTLEESVRNGWKMPLHPDDNQTAWEGWQSALATTGDYSTECRLRRADGAYRWWLIRGVPARDADGKVVKWFGTCTDIDELKQAQARISEQASLLDQTHDAIILHDLDRRVTFWSRGAERVYGWLAEEAIGRDVNELIQPDPAIFCEALDVVLLEGRWSGEIHEITKDGAKLTLASRWALLRNAQGDPSSILAISTDITERKKLEQQFLRAQRMESIGTLAGGIAHDLNNVLSPIMMSLAVLHTKFTDSESREMISMLSSSAQRGADMVRQILSFARGVEGRRMEVQPKHIINEIEKIARDTFPKNIVVRANIPRSVGTVVADPTQLHQVLLNLCVNARDAMPEGGTLAITVEDRILDEHYAALNPEAKPGSYVLLQIEDSGIGMSPEIMEKIFDPFFTTKEISKGTGLGLSTSLGIVKSHGGFLRAYSELGKGTKFCVYLPARAEPSEIAKAEITEMPRGNGELVLVIDDESFVRQILQQTLETFGYRVVLTSDGAEGLAVYASRRAEIAVVLIDMMMPVLDGPATIQVMRKINPAVRIIAASGLSTNGPEGHAAKLGVRHFLPKPYTAEVLLKVLNEALSTKGEGAS